jgi:hypothetical protein
MYTLYLYDQNNCLILATLNCVEYIIVITMVVVILIMLICCCTLRRFAYLCICIYICIYIYSIWFYQLIFSSLESRNALRRQSLPSHWLLRRPWGGSLLDHVMGRWSKFTALLRWIILYIFIHIINGNFRILKWRYVSTIFLAIFCGDIPLHRPYISLIYGRYLHFRILKFPLI